MIASCSVTTVSALMVISSDSCRKERYVLEPRHCEMDVHNDFEGTTHAKNGKGNRRNRELEGHYCVVLLHRFSCPCI